MVYSASFLENSEGRVWSCARLFRAIFGRYVGDVLEGSKGYYSDPSKSNEHILDTDYSPSAGGIRIRKLSERERGTRS